MDQHSTEAPDVMARLVRVADRYTSRWRESNDEHFRRAAKMVGRFIADLRAAICETCTRPSDQCNGVCVRVVPDKHKKKKAVAG